jgi:CheY-like chemotaxis protein
MGRKRWQSGRNGYEATRRIKSTTQGQATVVVALTASALEEDRQVILSEGCDDYVRKPFRDGELFEVLARHLGVQFVYAQAAVAHKAEDEQGERAAAETRRLAGMAALPPDLVTRLEQVAILGDMAAMESLINQIKPHHSALAAALAAWARDFEYDQILGLIRQAKQGEYECQRV